jgi:hypothetical protein
MDLGSVQPRFQWAPGEKLPKEETDHSPRYLREIKNVWNFTSTSTYASMATQRLLHHLILSPTRQYITLQLCPAPPTDLRG